MSAGGDAWYSGTLRTVPIGSRVNVHVPKQGYVAVGVTIGEPSRFDTAKVLVDGRWVALDGQQLVGNYHHGDPTNQTDDIAEWIIPVRWLAAVPVNDAYWEKGLFANQNSVCKLRQEFTLHRLAQHFNLDDLDSED